MINNNKVVLSKVNKQMISCLLNNFGSGPVDFNLSKNKKYLENRSFSNEFIAINGFTGWSPQPHPVDPFSHMRDTSIASMDYWYHADAFHHKDSDEPYVNTPHGYLIYEDVFIYSIN
jgi:hypothetical protein